MEGDSSSTTVDQDMSAVVIGGEGGALLISISFIAGIVEMEELIKKACGNIHKEVKLESAGG